MSRRPEIQVFACPACSQLYKRWVPTWINLDQPPDPVLSPSADIPRVCDCGRVFMLDESVIVTRFTPGERPIEIMTIEGVNRLEIPAFLRKREIEAEPSSAPPKVNPLWKGLKGIGSGIQSLIKFVTTKSEPKLMDPMWGVRREMVARAKPEQLLKS